jgi:putative flavoprotein involved in K+ transport
MFALQDQDNPRTGARGLTRNHHGALTRRLRRTAAGAVCGREHVVLERRRVGERWRAERWDSLRFQYPNWSLQLPGWRYEGADPGGFGHYSEIVRVIEDYAASTGAPVREHAEVTGLHRDGARAGFVVSVAGGPIRARRVVLATGPFQRPFIPPMSQDVWPYVYWWRRRWAASPRR